MKPEEEFEQWYKKTYGFAPSQTSTLREAFLAGYEQGYGPGSYDGYREGTGWDE